MGCLPIECYVWHKSIGFLWFGTTLGLLRYDGVQMEVFNKLSLVDNLILTDAIIQVEVDDMGRIIAHNDHGYILIYDYSKSGKNPIEYIEIKDSENKRVNIDLFTVTDSGMLLLIALNGDIYSLNIRTKIYTKILTQHSLFQNPHKGLKIGNIWWIGAENGLFKFYLDLKTLNSEHQTPTQIMMR